MKLEDQVVSLELAKRLKELGVKQESLFYWCSFDPRGETDWRGPYVVDGAPEDDGERWLRYPEGGQHTFRKNFDCGDTASAFTVAELGNSLRKRDIIYMPVTIQGNWTGVDTKKGSHVVLGKIGKLSEADARAKMLIYLIENNLMNV